MQTAQTFPTSLTHAIPNASDIPQLTHTEAGVLAREELSRFIQLVERITEEVWNRPTYCSLWNVQEVLAHQAGAYAGFASWGEFRRQYLNNPHLRSAKAPVDAINLLQVTDRAGKSPSKLLAELREVGPKAINTRQKLPTLLRALPIIPMGPPIGTASVGYLTDEIYLRDTWSHRLDISHAVGQEIMLTAEHDGRLTALVIRDLNGTLSSKLGGKAIIYELTGPAGGVWKIGKVVPTATLKMDAIDFHLLASGRVTVNASLDNNRINMTGDLDLAHFALEHICVLY